MLVCTQIRQAKTQSQAFAKRAGTAIDLIIFDPGISDPTALQQGLNPTAIALTLPRSGNPIATIGRLLQQQAPVRSLHILSHGRPGALRLGDRWITAADLCATDLAAWRESLTDEATISLYGCNLAREDLTLPERFAQLTGASVAASRTAMGAIQPGGNWCLDAIVGPGRSHLPWSKSVLAAYTGVFAVYEVGTENALRIRLGEVGSGDIISLTQNITLTSPLIISRDATIYGNGYAIDGGGTTYLMRGNDNPPANLALYDITLRNGFRQDPSAYYGAVNTNSINLAGSKVIFSNNRARADVPDSGKTYALGAAIYGSGHIHLADSRFENNSLGISDELRGRVEEHQSGNFGPGSFKPENIEMGHSVIYAIGGSTNLLDTTFSGNESLIFPPDSIVPIDLTNAQLVSLVNPETKLYATGGDPTDLSAISSGGVSRPQLSVASGGSITEGETGTVDFKLNAPLPYPLQFSYTIDGTTYSSVFPHSSTTYQASVSIADDNIYNPGRTINARVNTGNVYTLGTASTNIDINDTEPLISIIAKSHPSEDGEQGEFEIQLNKPAPRNFSVAYSVSGTATPGSDYEPLSGSVSIPEGATRASIMVDAIDDNIVDPDETIIVTLPNTTTNYGVDSSANEATLIIEDDEMLPVATLTALQSPSEEGPIPARFRIDFDNPALPVETQGGVSGTFVYYELVDGTTTAGQDYIAPSGQAFIPTGEDSVTIDVTIIDDLEYEPDGETFEVKLLPHPNEHYDLGPTDSLNFTIEDNNEIPEARMVFLRDATEEGSVPGEFRVELSSVALAGGVTIDYDLVAADSTATAADYVPLSGQVTIPEGETQATVSVTPIDDMVYDPDETLTFRLKPPTDELYSVSASDNEVTLTIIDNNVIPVASLEKLDNPLEDDETPGEFKIKLSSIALEGGVTVSYDVVAEQTTASSDDYAPLSGSVTFPAGSQERTVQVIPIDDGLHDPDETLTIRLSDPGSELYSVGVNDTVTFTIEDNDHLYEVRLTPEANASENGTPGYVLVELDRPALDLGLTIDYAISGGDAVANRDYIGLNGRITIPPGETQARIRIEAIDNAIDEPNRTLELSLLPAAPDQVIEPDRNYTADGSAQTAMILIEDNDTAAVRLTALSNTTNESGATAEIEVRLESEPLEPVTLDFTSSDPSEGELLISSVTFAPEEWKQAKTVTVRGVNDAIEDGDQPYSITANISSDDPAYNSLSSETLNLINQDNDGYRLLASTPSRVTEGDISTYTLVLTQPPSEAIPIEILADDQTEVSLDGSSFTSSLVTTFTNTDSQTIFIRAIDDTEVEGRHSGVISHRFLDHGDSNYPSASETISTILTIDDNDRPLAGIITTDNSTEESVVAGRFGVVLDQSAPAGGVTIAYSIVNQTATSDLDYVPLSGSLFIPEGADGGDIIVNPLQDDIVELGGEIITIALQPNSEYDIDPTYASGTVTIFDDDIPGVRVRERGNATRVRENVAGDSYTLELTSQPSDPVTIDINTSGDVTPSVTRVSFDASNWNLPQTVQLSMLDNNIADGDRTQVISHSVSSADSNYDGMSIDGTTITIIDDDVPGMGLLETGFSTRVTEGSVTDDYVVSLDSQPTEPVTVTVIQAADSGLEAIAPLVFTPTNWSTPQTVDVVVIDDFIDRGDRTTTLTHQVTSADENYDGWLLDEVTVFVTEDDEAGMILSESAGGTAVVEGSSDDAYTIVLTSEPVEPVTVEIVIDGTSNLEAIAPLVFEPSQWNVPQTVDVKLMNDDIDDDDRSAIFQHLVSSDDPNYDDWDLQDVPVSITEDDFVGLTIRESGPRTYVIEGSDNPDFIEIFLSSEPIADVRIAFDTGSELEPIPDLVIPPQAWDSLFRLPIFAKLDTNFQETEVIELGFTVTSADPKYDPTGGLEDTIPAPPPIPVIVGDRQLLGNETADGLGIVLDRFETLFTQNLRSQTFPILSESVDSLVPDLFVFKDRLLADLRELGSVDGITTRATITKALTESFQDAGLAVELDVTPSIDLDEIAFMVNVNYEDQFTTPLNPNLGIDDLKFQLNGDLDGQFQADLAFRLGWHQNFGFFIDAEETQLNTNFDVKPPREFTAQGGAGLLGAKANDDDSNPTAIAIDYNLSLTDIDDVNRIRFLDANNNGIWDDNEPMVEEQANGTFPSLPILGRFDLDGSGGYEPEEGTILTIPKPDDGDRLTLTELLKNANNPQLVNGDFTGTHNLGLNLDTQLPGLENLPLPRYLFALAADWGDLTYDPNQDLLQPLQTIPNLAFNNFGIDVGSIGDFVLPIFEGIGPFLQPLNLFADLLDFDVIPAPIGDFFGLFDINSIAGIKVNPLNFQNFLEGIANIDLDLGDFKVQLQNFLRFPSLIANLPTGFLNFGSFQITSPDLPQLDLNLPTLDLPRLPSPSLDLGSMNLPQVAGDFDISQLNRSRSIRFPVLTDPMQGLYLILGKEDVTLATLETPNIAARGSIDAKTSIFQSFTNSLPNWVKTLMDTVGVGKFDAHVKGSFDVRAGMGFGFDTFGLFRWANTGFDPEQSDLILDSFFVSDRANPDGTGEDVKELYGRFGIGVDLEAGKLLSVSGKGLLNGEVKVDLLDPNGDGKVRFHSEVLPQIKSLNNLISAHGNVAAAGSATLKFSIDYPNILPPWDTKTYEKDLYEIDFPSRDLFSLSVGKNGVSFGTALDGPIQGADVFFDANFNGIWDDLEPATISFGAGDYDLEIPLDLFDRNGDGKIDLTEGQIVVQDGTDIDTFQKQRFPFFTAPEWTIASPLTSLALRLAQPDLPATAARLGTAFGLPGGFDLQTDNAFTAIENGDSNGATVLIAQGQLQNLIILGANTLQPEGDRNDIANAIIAEVSDRVRNGTAINLTDEQQITSILTRAAGGRSSVDLSATIAEIQTRNQAIIEARNTPIEDIREAITSHIALDQIDGSYFNIAVDPWSVLLRTSQPVPPLDAASDRVLTLLDLPNIDLGTFDPFANLDNRFGVEVLTRQIQIHATVAQLADIAIGTGVEDAQTQIFEAMVTAIETGVELADFSNPDVIVALLQAVARPPAALQMAQIIASSNANFTAIANTAIDSGNFATVRDDLVELQVMVQSLQAQLLKSVAGGRIGIDQFESLMAFNQSGLNLTTVIENIIEGTEENDTLIGTNLNDWIAGRSGDDLIEAGEGDNIIYGNTGDDTIYGGDGDDVIHGGRDNDVIDGGSGDNILYGDWGDDIIYGGDGDDLINGGEGDDTLFGKAGNNFIRGGPGNDVIYGGDGDDYILGEAGDDLIHGGDGDDLIIGGDGDDTIHGEAGDDTLVGLAGDDLIYGGSGNNILFGNTGNDTLYGGEGDDTIAAGKDDDLVFGESGNNYLFGNIGNDTLYGGDGDDLIHGGQDDDVLIGGEGNDTLSGDLGNDVLIGGPGADVFQLRLADSFDIIVDFVAGEDKVQLVGFATELTFEDLSFSPAGENTQLTIDDQAVAIFNGVVNFTPDDILGLAVSEL
ncbi:MAG: putative Ca2+-binding protein [Phormidium sp. OSCR]|nr:MAG: putative Ca2+-binding protein [Phormidium sp. OSCR]